MAPKKSVESKTTSNEKSQEKLGKSRGRQLKPKLNPPLLIKLKIPGNSENMSSKTAVLKEKTTPKLTRKQLTVTKKLELANEGNNEVAAAQLGNKQHTVLETAPIVIVPPKPKRGRRKKIQEPVEAEANSERCTVTSESQIATDSEDAFDLTPKKRNWRRRKVATKQPEAVNATKGNKSLSLSTLKQTKLTDAKSGITKTPKPAMKTEYNTRKKNLKPETGKKIGDNPTTEAPQPLSTLDQIDQKKENTETPKSSKTEENVEPCTIDSRKTSLTSECLSWTKDISSSSTTTCVTVCSTDIVRIDKKMPVIKLTPTTGHLNQNLNASLALATENNESSSSDSESSVSEHSPIRRSQKEFTPEIESRSLNLSTSSISPTNSPRPVSSFSLNSVDNKEQEKITYCLDKLASKLKHFDLEIINWIGYENEEVDSERNTFHDNIFKMLKEESEVITHCRHLKLLLSDNFTEEETVTANEKNTQPVNEECDPVKIVNFDSADDNASARSPMRVTSEISEDDENNFTSDRVRYIPFDQSCDDDDALSLFAESITGMESSRRNSSAASMCTTGDFEEYVPLPLDKEKWEPAKKISYTPTYIGKQTDVKAKPICEKQNADSTSIYKESEQCKDKSAPFKKNNPHLLISNAGTPNKPKPCLMSFLFKPLSGVKSGVFRGICFFNILSSCKNNKCRFPHVIPSYEEISAKLTKLSEEMFIQEYMLMRNWPVLRRKYGLCFVHECIKRDLTRILVEMALDFVIKANESYRNDILLKVAVIECVLLHLNSVDLEICEDILLYKHQDELLCEIFMRVISNTQNFSRFKPVFINLTKFILKQERMFSLEVATQFLERICILPCEPPLLEALLDIVKSTDPAILKNSMLGHFENQLSVASKELHDDFLKLKKEASMNWPVLQHLYESSPKAVPEREPAIANSLVNEREKRYTSPDTTNLDTMNKPTDEPTITRTIDLSRAKLFGCTIQRSISNSNSSSNDSSEDIRPKVMANPHFKNWKDRSIFNSIPALSPSPGQWHGTPRPSIKRHIHQPSNFGPAAPKFPRRSGPDFF